MAGGICGAAAIWLPFLFSVLAVSGPWDTALPSGAGEPCPGAQAMSPGQDGVVWPGQHPAVASAERSPALVSRRAGRVPFPGLHRPGL